jgi:Flp pilus assembly protein TadG
MSAARRQTGAALIWATFAIALMGVMVAVALNVGHLASVRGELRNAADAGALAGVMELDGTDDGLDDAVGVAIDQAGRHSTDRIPIALDAGDVQLGRWAWNEPSATAFHPISEIQSQYPGQPAEVARRVTAVRVRTDRAQMPFVFPGLVRRAGADVAAAAVAAGGGPCQVQCALPFTIADCNILSRCGTTLYLRASPAPTDLMAFTVLSSSQATRPTITELIDQILAGQCPSTGEGDLVQVNNGNLFNPVDAHFQALIDAQPPNGYWVAVTGGYDCTNPQFVQNHPIVGFVRVRLEQVSCCGSNAYLSVRFDCDVHDSGRGGCIYYGTHARPMLVR